MTDSLTATDIVVHERAELVRVLRHAGPTTPTLCEGWQTRHLVAHLLLRESKPAAVAGVALPFLAGRTERLTNELADELRGERRYEKALDDFVALPGYFGLRRRFPAVDAVMNTMEYFIHCEDVRRAGAGTEATAEPREVPRAVQEKLWADLFQRGRLIAGKEYKDGLVLEAPGFSPATVTVIAPKPGTVAPVLTGEPGELALFLYGRQGVAHVKTS